MMNATEKVSDLVARFCSERSMTTAFVVAGGASMHLIHAFASHPGCNYVPMHHEQAAAMAADGFARSGGGTGLAIATSGPGATNLITGMAGAFYDSIPVLFVIGQVSTTRMVGDTGVRQIGFQETPIVSMVRPITKLATQLSSPTAIRFELERAFWTMHDGRPGPVVLEIPDNLQRERVQWDELEPFRPTTKKTLNPDPQDLLFLQDLLNESERPVMVGGWGVHLASAKKEFEALVKHWNIPTVLTWGAADLLSGDNALRVGTFGTHGARHANLAIQNADLVISVGSRLDTKATGSPVNSFAREAKKVIVDIDKAELSKFSTFDLHFDLEIHSDAKAFLENAMALKKTSAADSRWIDTISNWQNTLKPYDEAARMCEGLDPYRFMKDLLRAAPNDLDLYLDTGCLLPWLLQDYQPASKQRIFHDFNNTAMGWALPAMIGGMTARPERPAVCVVGDGSLMMSVHELATLVGQGSASRLVLIDNSGYSMIRQTQDQWLDSDYFASSSGGGLSFPNFQKLAEAFGFNYNEVSEESLESSELTNFWTNNGHQFLRVVISDKARVIPQVRFGRPNEDMDPLLTRDVFFDSMIIEPLAVSRTRES